MNRWTDEQSYRLRALYAEIRDLRAERDNPFREVSREERRQLNVRIVRAHKQILELLNPNHQ